MNTRKLLTTIALVLALSANASAGSYTSKARSDHHPKTAACEAGKTYNKDGVCILSASTVLLFVPKFVSKVVFYPLNVAEKRLKAYNDDYMDKEAKASAGTSPAVCDYRPSVICGA